MNITTWDMDVAEPWYSYIKNGTKKVEGRKNNPNTFGRIRIGDFIKMINQNTYFKVEVIDIKYYSTLEEYLFDVGVGNALPGVQTLQEGITIYKQWSNNEELKLYGFMGIFIKLL